MMRASLSVLLLLLVEQCCGNIRWQQPSAYPEAPQSAIASSYYPKQVQKRVSIFHPSAPLSSYRYTNYDNNPLAFTSTVSPYARKNLFQYNQQEESREATIESLEDGNDGAGDVRESHTNSLQEKTPNRVDEFDADELQHHGDEKHGEVHYHQHKHVHKHNHKQEHKHEHKQTHEHKHGHHHGHKHDHHHGHKHEHKHHQHHKHSHHHGHEAKHEHKHHHGHKHDHHHGHKHGHHHGHKHEHKHHQEHKHGHKHEHKHGHKHGHKHHHSKHH